MTLQALTRSDRRALLPLLIIAVALVVALWYMSSRNNAAPPDDDTAAMADSTSRHGASQDQSTTTTADDTTPALHSFDPNTVDSATLVGFGLRPYKARAFMRYREAGAVFQKPLDIAHVYSLDDDDIDRLLPYISIGTEYQHRRTKYPIGADYGDAQPRGERRSYAGTEERPSYESNKFSKLTRVDPNEADTALLKRIPGIGSNIAAWIVRHRDRLGGFHSVDQLLEVQYVSTDMLEWFDIQSDSLRLIDINTASFHILSSHPYIGYSRAKAIDNRRRLYGRFANIDELSATGLFTPDTLALLTPYLQY